MIALLLAATVALPPVIADPRRGPSEFVMLGSAVERPRGVLVPLPADPEAVDQGWLETVVALSARRAAVLSLGGVPPARVRPYLDGAVLEPAPSPAEIPQLRFLLAGVPLVVPAADPAAAVAALAAGATSVLMPAPPASFGEELWGLVDEPRAARLDGTPLPTALRTADLATVVGLPAGFAGGTVHLPGDWYAAARLVTHASLQLPLAVHREASRVAVPPLPQGGVLVVVRPGGGGGPVDAVEVRGERLPSAAEVLARHQRVAARGQQLARRWRAVQRLLLRVFVAELGRSFEVVLEGPAFHTAGLGTDWEIARAWVDGVAWDPAELPDLPLLEPERPPVPPLVLRLDPRWTFEVVGMDTASGTRCYLLAFRETATEAGPRRRGTACIDAESFALLAMEERAENLPGVVRATRSVSHLAPVPVGGEAVWLPHRIVADDLMSAFGGSATIHRELTLTEVAVETDGFDSELAAAYARPNRMLRDAPGGLAPLIPDGKGGRRVGDGRGASQTFLIAGLVDDPGLDFPLPFGGLQIQDFDFRGRGEQFRALIAGAVNDAAWSKRLPATEINARAFLQLVPFASSLWVAGAERRGERLRVMRQRVGAGVARTVGTTRVLFELGLERWDFRRADETGEAFVLPRDTFEGVARLETQTVFGATTLTVAGEVGRRAHWQAWGIDGAEEPERRWQRGQIGMVRETTPFPLARLHLGVRFFAGSHLDRFSAPSPARFGSIRIRGIASGRIAPERLVLAGGALAMPVGPRLRLEVGADAAWAWEQRSGYRGRSLAGVGVAVSAKGPWKTLLEAGVSYPLATPGARALAFELFLLRPL